MNTPVKLGAYLLGLCGVFGAAAGVGAAVGPVGAQAESHAGTHGDESPTPAPTTAPAHAPGGLAVSNAGYTLEVAPQLSAGPAVPVSLRILAPGGAPLTDFETVHEKQLHLIAVRRDLTGYQHVHPTMAPDGTWSAPLDLSAGTWRLFADFDPAGPTAPLVLGTDVAVAGDYEPHVLPEPRLRADVDGYTVTLSGSLVAGQEQPLQFTVTRDGAEVTDLQPYLGAYGHLVALRSGDLAYLHVHPKEAGTAGPGMAFLATAPSAGDYRLFLDFRHGDVVRTAEFTVRAGPSIVGDADGHTEDGPTDDGHTDDGHTDDGHTH